MDSRRGGGGKEPSIMVFLDPQAAFHDAVIAFGVSELAKALRKPLAWLYNKINPSQQEKPLHFREAIEWSAMMNSTLALEAWARASDGVFVKMPPRADVADDELYRIYTQLMADIGKFSGEFHHDVSGGKLTSRELAKLEKDIREFQSVSEELLQRLRKRAGR